MGKNKVINWLLFVLVLIVMTSVWTMETVTKKFVHNGLAHRVYTIHPHLFSQSTAPESANTPKESAVNAAGQKVKGDSQEERQIENPQGQETQGQGSMAQVINPVLTDAQVMQSVSSQNQINQKMNQVVADRENQMAQVHRAIMESGVMASSEAKPFVAPQTFPPSNIVQEIKSHQMTAH